VSLFALESFNPGQRRSLEALLLSAKLPLATTDQAGVTHILVSVAAEQSRLKETYPSAEIVAVDCSQLHELPDRLRKLGQAQTPVVRQELIGTSRQIEAVRKTIALIATSDVTVLITGETGCGKECAARMVHRLSKRNKMPLIALNCAAIPDTMLEGELFGYEKGAFTGAIKAYPGKVKLADGGTLALDEIGDLSQQGQAKILRAIETHEFYRLGSSKLDHFNARLVAMTNVDLASACMHNTFRKDLYYRLAVAEINLPPLRERREDILPIAQHFLAKSSHVITANAADALQSYSWPGNVRELNNVMILAALTSTNDIIDVQSLPKHVQANQLPHRPNHSFSEKQLLLDALKTSHGNKSMAAKTLNWSRMTLYRKLEMHHIAPNAVDVTKHVTT
jgi:DNA-binding NtrC family response regulator